MRKLWILLGLTLAGAHSALAAPPPVDAFGKIPQVRNVTLSPNGALVAWEDNSGAQTAVVVYDLLAKKQRAGLRIEKGTKLRNVEFADDGTLLVDLSIAQTLKGTSMNRDLASEWMRTLAVDVATGESRVLLLDDEKQAEVVNQSELLAARTARPGTVVMAKWNYEVNAGRSAAGTRIANRRQDSNWVYSVYSVDTHTGHGARIEMGTQFTRDWIVDAAGAPVARSEWDPTTDKFRLVAKQGGGWKTVYEADEHADVEGLSADGHSVLIIAPDKGVQKLWAVPLDGSPAKVELEEADSDVINVVRDVFTRLPVAVTLSGASLHTQWLDKKSESRHTALEKAFPGRKVGLVGRSEDFKRVLAYVEAESSPPIYYLVDFGTGRADIVGEAYPALANVKLGEVRSITYPARDGTAIPAYVTLPPDAAEKSLPLVVLPHGGPEARDYPDFDWWAQFLASRGYVVLQPQFRGSTGFGDAHRRAGYRQWGGLMQDDVTDGVKALVDQGLADPHRICIVGASYGGYAALAGAAFTPDLYVCAASINGVSDLPLMLGQERMQGGSSASSDSDNVRYWRNHIGSAGDANVIAKSPARAAQAVKAPVLLIHGVDDTVVSIQQSSRMYDALTALKKPVKFVKLPGEDHWLSSSETRVRMLTELDAFLRTYLAPPTGTTTAAPGDTSP